MTCMVGLLILIGQSVVVLRPHRVEALSNDVRLTSVCLSHTSGLSREQRPRKNKIGRPRYT